MNIDDGKMISVVFLDIRKAFDTVDHQIMLDKLKCYGVHKDELAFFMSNLNDRRQCCNGLVQKISIPPCGGHVFA